MAPKHDTAIENAFADTVGELANPFAGPPEWTEFGFRMLRSSFLFWSELAEAMLRANAAMLQGAGSAPGRVSSPASGEAGASSHPARPVRPAPRKLRVVASGDAETRPQTVPVAKTTPDDLKAISGIGPKLESVLNGMGISTYAHLAALDAKTVARIEDKLGFSGRVGRDDWVGQAKALRAAARTGGSI